MKKIAKLLHNKGFTLVECIIAIAVFAVLTSMVIMIVGNSVKLQKEASDAERDLNNVVQNVVQDDTNRVYGDNSRTLEMMFDSSSVNFRMTYSTVDGYKSFIECPACGNKADDIEYMSYIYETARYKNWPTVADKAAGASEDDKQNYKISYWFGLDSTTDHFECPACGHTFTLSALKAKCNSCLKEDTLNNFDFNKGKGNFVCKDCKGEDVVQIVEKITYDLGGNPISSEWVPISDSITSDANFVVSGIAANAVRYGKVESLEKEKVKDLTTLDGITGGSYTMKLEYIPNTSAVKPGKYRVTIPSVMGLGSDTGTIRIYLPGCYIPKITGGNADGSSGHPTASITPSTDYSKVDMQSCLVISDITSTSSSNIIVEFTLTNYKNSHSFEEDYKYEVKPSSGETALGKLWFLSGATTNVPRIDLGV